MGLANISEGFHLVTAHDHVIYVAMEAGGHFSSRIQDRYER
jgi:hypothetical protein